MFKKILITGGAGFVGSNLAILMREAWPGVEIFAFDNLKRRGSELNLARLGVAGVKFFHGDIRCREDFDELPNFDLLVDCSAEPSVQAGLSGAPDYLVQTNLCGTLNLLELARRQSAAFLFLSTSRVYPIASIAKLPFHEAATRYEWLDDPAVPGFSAQGLREDFPLDGPRSLYGASKLAGELMLQEYVYTYKMPALINRCGLLTGPWQMGKVDQGVITLWVARHLFGKPLKYIGFGGTGKQVRDLLHVRDLFRLIAKQCADPGAWDGSVYNVGGGREMSVSLLELTGLCRAATGQAIPVEPVAETSPVDLRLYLSDSAKVRRRFGWQPEIPVSSVVDEIRDWIMTHRESLKNVF